MNNATIDQLAQMRGTPAVSILCPLDNQRARETRRIPGSSRTLRDHADRRKCAPTCPGATASSMVARIDEARAASISNTQHPALPSSCRRMSPASSRSTRSSTQRSSWLNGSRSGDSLPHCNTAGAQGSSCSRGPRRDASTSPATPRPSGSTSASLSRFKRRSRPTPRTATSRSTSTSTPRPPSSFPRRRPCARRASTAGRAPTRTARRRTRPRRTSTRSPRQGANIVGRLNGNYERQTANAVEDLVQPVLDTHQLALQQQACAETREAIGSHAVAGIVDTWTAARPAAGTGSSSKTSPGSRRASSATRSNRRRTMIPARSTRSRTPSRKWCATVATSSWCRPDSLTDVGRIALVTRY